MYLLLLFIAGGSIGAIYQNYAGTENAQRAYAKVMPWVTLVAMIIIYIWLSITDGALEEQLAVCAAFINASM